MPACRVAVPRLAAQREPRNRGMTVSERRVAAGAEVAAAEEQHKRRRPDRTVVTDHSGQTAVHPESR
eukprot:1759661-Prymnesium_polylepis.1